tara:strand:- start:227 stop:1219 length:993 start_codon:yes stop_codon:yes gene_type:complete
MPDRPNILFISETGDLNKDALNAYNKNLNKHNVEPGPFVTDTHQWTNLALKRMIRWGSDNGFDSIGWVTGKQSAERYKASTMVDSIYWNPETTQLVAIEKGGNNKVINELVPEDKLVDFIGKEPANRLLKSQLDKDRITQQWQDGLLSDDEMYFMANSHSLQGADLDIGGEYHKLIYDQVLTAQAKKIGKKHGAKVEEGSIGKGIYRHWLDKNNDAGGYELNWYEDGELLNVNIQSEDKAAASVAAQKYLENLVKDGRNVARIDAPGDLNARNPVEKVWSMRLTDKLKNAAKDGMPYYVALPPLVMGAAAQRTDAQRQQSKSDAQQILAN